MRSHLELQEEGANYLRILPISPEHLRPHEPHQLKSTLHASRATLPVDRIFGSHTPGRHGEDLAGPVEPQDLEHTKDA